MTKILLFGEPLIRISPLDATSIGDHVASSTYFGGSKLTSLVICKPWVSQRKSLPHSCQRDWRSFSHILETAPNRYQFNLSAWRSNRPLLFGERLWLSSK